MRTNRPTRSAISRRRTGLAPLEFVLALPLMLFVMALMVNIGSMGAWKVREQANVRNASWRTLHLRTGDSNPNPPLWPSEAAVNGGSGNDASQVNQRWDNGELFTQAVRGKPQRLTAPNQSDSYIIVNPMLDMEKGVHDGSARLERQIPLLRGAVSNGGRYAFDVRQNLLDGNWEYHNLRFQGEGFSRNHDRRARVLYDIEPGDFPSVAQLQSQARMSLAEIQNPQNYQAPASWFDLAPLDADPDLSRLSVLPPRSNSNRPTSPGGGTTSNDPSAPDLYPGREVLAACLIDPSMLQTSGGYTQYLERVRRLPGSVARTFLSWYQGRLSYLQQLPMPSAADQQEMQQLQDDIDKLNQFQGALPPQNR